MDVEKLKGFINERIGSVPLFIKVAKQKFGEIDVRDFEDKINGIIEFSFWDIWAVEQVLQLTVEESLKVFHPDTAHQKGY